VRRIRENLLGQYMCYPMYRGSSLILKGKKKAEASVEWRKREVRATSDSFGPSEQ